MTDTNTKVRSLILTALMVVSVFGGSIAFAGSAAAANNNEIQLSSSGAGDAGVEYTASGDIEATSSNDMQYLTVTFSEADLTGVTASDLRIESPDNDGGSSTFNLNSASDYTTVERDGADDTLSIELSDSQSVGQNDRVIVEVGGVTNPNSAGDYNYDVVLETTSEGTDFDTLTGSYTIEETESDLSAGSDDATFNQVVYSGEELTVNGFTGDELVNVRYVTERSDGDVTASTQVDQLQADGGEATLDTGELDENGDYFLVGQDSANEVGFELATHTLDAVIDPTTVENGDEDTDVNLDDSSIQDAETEFDVETNRASPLLYQVDSETLEDAELKQIFQEYQPDNGLLEEEGIMAGEDGEGDPLQFDENDYANGEGPNYDAGDDEEYDDEDPIDEDGIIVAFEDEQADELVFSGVDTGDYTLDVSHVETTAEDSVDVTVTEAADGDANFGSSVYSTNQGDRVMITVDLEDSDVAQVQVGEYDDVNYEAVVTVEDDGDNEVSFWYNTYSPLTDNAFTLTEASEDDGDTLTWDSDVTLEDGDEGLTEETVNEDTPAAGVDSYLAADFGGGAGVNDLAAASYDISAYVGGSETAVGTLEVNERTVGGVQMWTLAEDEVSDVSDLEELNTAAEEGFLTQDDSNAVRQGDNDNLGSGDAVVHQIQITGIYGAIETGTETGDAVQFSDLAPLLGATSSDDTFGEGGAELVLSQTDDTTEANADPLVLNLDESSDALTIIPDSENGSLYIIAEPGDNLDFNRVSESEIDDLTDDDTGNFDESVFDGDLVNAEYNDAFDVEFFIPEESGLTSQDVSATSSFEFVERDASFDQNDDDEVVVAPSSEQTISGTTSIAAGSEITIRARATGDNPFLKTADVTVGEDGDFSGTFDFSDTSNMTEFEVTIPSEGFEDDAETDGIVSDAAQMETPTPEPETATPEPETATPEPETATPEPETATPTDGGDGATETETSGSQPGFGGAVAIIALAGAALIALRRGN
ncbi:BGTF surface domain-containing protein [Halosegnis longus]|uniref:PGF-CTERM sorting domain-containing protein n=1 Tax=Halosegnis longus TaxID=2216012 RepID=A0AAJ4RA59_9EURY|nr:PGF-CTERM sorting domain-containing protein [Salella cibi]